MKRRDFLAAMVGTGILGRTAQEAPKTNAHVRFVSWGGIGSLKRVKAAKRIGIDTHRLPINPWSDEKGKRDFRLAEVYLPALKEADITTIVHIFSHGVPQWFWEKHPEAMPRNEKGEIIKEHGSVWHPLVRFNVCQGIEALFEHLERKNLMQYVDGIEVGVAFEGQLSYLWHHFWAFDPNALMAYRFFLRGRYRDIEALAKAWGKRYKSFDEITPPTKWEDTQECGDFMDFYCQSLLDAAEEWSGFVASRFSPKIWLWLSHFIAPDQRPYSARYPKLYLQRLRELGRADVAIVSVVPGWQTKAEVDELKQMGIRVIGEWLITPTEEEQKRQAQLAWDLGCDGFFVGVLENLSDEDGNLTSVGKTTAQIIEQWKQNM